MKIFITGGTGFVGSFVSRELGRLGHDVTIITRSPDRARISPKGVSFLAGDPTRPGDWQEKIPDYDVIVNLAGASIFTPWTEKARRTIVESRVHTTRNVVDALSACMQESLLLSASAVGYYGGREDDEVLDESSAAGTDFLSLVGQQWEKEARRAENFGVRVVLCRFGIVLGREGGALGRMAPAFKKFLGSPFGTGRQWFPWIHEQDILNILLYLVENRDITGPLNCVSPNPVRNVELTRTLADVLKSPLLLPSVPKFVLRTLLGEFGDILLKGQRAIPKRLLDEGYEFKYPLLRGALQNLLT